MGAAWERARSMRAAWRRERETSSMSHLRPRGPAGFQATSTCSAISRRMLAVEYRSAVAACATVIPRGAERGFTIDDLRLTIWGSAAPTPEFAICPLFNASTVEMVSHGGEFVRKTGAFFCKKRGNKKHILRAHACVTLITLAVGGGGGWGVLRYRQKPAGARVGSKQCHPQTKHAPPAPSVFVCVYAETGPARKISNRQSSIVNRQ